MCMWPIAKVPLADSKFFYHNVGDIDLQKERDVQSVEKIGKIRNDVYIYIFISTYIFF